ncbi:MAG: hypothetical protein ACHQ52_11740 [Candidatus Eisenbacteria bacterium]
MNRPSTLRTLLAVSIALLLPIEQAHCAWMGAQPSARTVVAHAVTTTTVAVPHACCAAASAFEPAAASRPAPAPERIPQACVCEQLPPGALPNAFLHGAPAPTVTSIATLTVPAVIAPVAVVTTTIPALDVGSPPLPDDPGAHGLRAPPVSA